MNARSVQPIGDRIVVLADPRPTMTGSGLIHLPGEESGLEKVSQGTGLLIAVGDCQKNKAIGIEPGQKIVYRSYLKYAYPLETEEKWLDGSRKEFFIMKTDDADMIVPHDMTVHVFGGRPQVSTKKEPTIDITRP